VKLRKGGKSSDAITGKNETPTVRQLSWGKQMTAGGKLNSQFQKTYLRRNIYNSYRVNSPQARGRCPGTPSKTGLGTAPESSKTGFMSPLAAGAKGCSQLGGKKPPSYIEHRSWREGLNLQHGFVRQKKNKKDADMFWPQRKPTACFKHKPSGEKNPAPEKRRSRPSMTKELCRRSREGQRMFTAKKPGITNEWRIHPARTLSIGLVAAGQVQTLLAYKSGQQSPFD